ncbi:MAG TPA: glycosyltransferase family 9 protein [Rhodopila sp.]|nr:glycosyltransferase family 9 protein [Rhodopila sp.]
MRGRLGRAKQLLAETVANRGWFAASIYLARLLWRKTPYLVSNVVASRRTRQIRSSIDRSRREIPTETPYLALAITGGLGDAIVIARFIRDLANAVGGIRFDVFSPTPSQAVWVFAHIPGFNAAYHDLAFDHVVAQYDLAMRLNQFVIVYKEAIRWDRIRSNHQLMAIVDNVIRFRANIESFVNVHPWLDNFLAQTAVFHGATRRDFLHLMAKIRYSENRLALPQDRSVLQRLDLLPGSYVTVHNGFDPGFLISNQRATKCYPYFGSVVTMLKVAFPDLHFVQIGTVTSEPIPECDMVLVNKTNLDEVVALIANSVLHLDNEGGLVHVSAAVGTQSVVVFGPTPANYFGYPENINIEPPVCGNCWWMTRTWMDACAKRYDTPKCMTEQTPDIVATKARRAIEIYLAQPDTAKMDAPLSTSIAHTPEMAQTYAS